jgi:hypothetical protein
LGRGAAQKKTGSDLRFFLEEGFGRRHEGVFGFRRSAVAASRLEKVAHIGAFFFANHFSLRFAALVIDFGVVELAVLAHVNVTMALVALFANADAVGVLKFLAAVKALQPDMSAHFELKARA